MVAEIAPRPDVPVVVRKLPERRTLPKAGPLVVPSRGGGLMLGLGPDPTLVLGPGQRLGLGPGPTLELRPDAVPALESGARQDLAAVSQNAFHTQDLVAREGSAVPNSRTVFVSGMPPSVAASSAPPPVIASSLPPPVVQPLSPGRYKVQFTASAALRDKLERLQARSPDPSPSSRHIPAAIRRAVCERDRGRCRYVDEQGRQCRERDRLEFHHRRPFGLGGGHSLLNVGLLCRAHNAYLAECDYGSETMARHRRAPSRTSPTATG